MTRHELRAALAWALPAGGVLAALHALLWRDGETGWFWSRYGRLGAYLLGHGTLAAAFTGWALRTGQVAAARALWVISSVGGLVVVGCWLTHVNDAALRALAFQVAAAQQRFRAWTRNLRLALTDPDPGQWQQEEVQ